MNKNTIVKSLAVLGVLVILLSGGIGIGKAASNDAFMEKVAKYAGTAVADKLEKLGALSLGIGEFLGSAQTVALHATAGSVTNGGGLFLWDTDTNSGLEVKGPTWLQETNVSSTLTVVGTTTIGFAPNQVNVTRATLNTATTTNCAIQNTFGENRVISGFYFNNAAGSSANTVNSQFRAYVSLNRADGNTTSTNLLMKQMFIASSSLPLSYGGPVPSSYFVTSSPELINGIGIASTTPVMWPIGYWVNMTSTAKTTSTGSCLIENFSF